ncbi:MAG: SEC-C metal-binding domain-containing protein, partial [Holosporales bacterium]
EWLKKLGLQEGESITHPWINRAIEKAQQKIEARNFEIRKHLLKYDDVMNDQRKAVYAQRYYLMAKDELQQECGEMRTAVVQALLEMAIPPQSYSDQWNMQMLHEEVLRIFDLDLPFQDWSEEDGMSSEVMSQRLGKAIEDAYQAKENRYGSEILRMAERNMLLRFLDQVWKDHLHSLDNLRQGVHLRSYAQKDPLNEYKREAFALFESMLNSVAEKITEFLFHFQTQPESAQRILQALVEEDDVFEDVAYSRTEDEEDFLKENNSFEGRGAIGASEISRNAPCPCGSGTRYKNCHGKL